MFGRLITIFLATALIGCQSVPVADIGAELPAGVCQPPAPPEAFEWLAMSPEEKQNALDRYIAELLMAFQTCRTNQLPAGRLEGGLE